jgi:peptidoglycan/LPS O-acetylase OafA/YrhL
MSAKSLRYIPSLDGLRGLAAILVLAAHYGYSEVGWIGLEFFFVLSGFLITSILLTERNRRLGEYLGRFLLTPSAADPCRCILAFSLFARLCTYA